MRPAIRNAVMLSVPIIAPFVALALLVLAPNVFGIVGVFLGGSLLYIAIPYPPFAIAVWWWLRGASEASARARPSTFERARDIRAPATLEGNDTRTPFCKARAARATRARAGGRGEGGFAAICHRRSAWNHAVRINRALSVRLRERQAPR